ncbi:MAG: DUF3099 domain-containing protein [Microbacteriaceae bacterium]|nr:MAG: DUF3099 domain-containing protein [Microbacteriaceae bacterium]
MKQQTITSLPQAPDAERRGRVIKYSVAMGIRVLCILSILFIHGWWVLIPAAGAVFLPYVAVVIANVGAGERSGRVERPGNIVRAGGTAEPRETDSTTSSEEKTG